MTQFFVLVGLAMGVLAIATWLGIAKLEVAHPPTGDFVEVEGCGCTLRCSAFRQAPPAQTLPSC